MKRIDSQDFIGMIAAGQARLKDNSDYVNSLNVFPVPDGDTGTNMNLTFTSGLEAVRKSSGERVGEIGLDLAKGLLMGARGNSGVILSQLFRGFSKVVERYTTLNASRLARGFQGGVDAAYKAIMKPVEGTILTVARESAQAGIEKAAETDDPVEVMRTVLEAAQAALDQTPEQLPVLKEVGVVDSGGQGLVFIYEGFLSALTGEAPTTEFFAAELSGEIADVHVHDSVNPEDIVFGYCTEIMVRIGEGETVDSEFDLDEFRNYLSDLGDSLVVVADEEIIKVHVHTEHPGEVMNYGQKFGSLIKVKVDNMREQNRQLHENNQSAPKPAKSVAPKDIAIISVAAGAGVNSLFKDFGVDKMIEGGQTMNPSTEDFVKAMEEVPAKAYLLLPNNSNIFMAAKQAAEVSDTPTYVVETRSIQQGLTSLLAFNPTLSVGENYDAMSEMMTMVKAGQITYAIRDTEINGLSIKKDHYMGLIDGDIKKTNPNLLETAYETIKEMLDDETEIVTLIYGEGVTEEQAEELAERVEELNDDIDIEIHSGNQPVYQFLISVE